MTSSASIAHADDDLSGVAAAADTTERDRPARWKFITDGDVLSGVVVDVWISRRKNRWITLVLPDGREVALHGLSTCFQIRKRMKRTPPEVGDTMNVTRTVLVDVGVERETRWTFELVAPDGSLRSTWTGVI